jgi:hypothetical protein
MEHERGVNEPRVILFLSLPAFWQNLERARVKLGELQRGVSALIFRSLICSKALTLVPRRRLDRETRPVYPARSVPALHPSRVAKGVIFPRRLFHRVKHPAIRNAPGMVFLAFRKGRAEPVFGERISTHRATGWVG